MQHYAGRADHDAGGTYFVRGLQGYEWDQSYSWSGFAWSDGFVWNDGFIWSDAFTTPMSAGDWVEHE